MLVLVPNGFASKEGLVRVGLRYPWLRHSTVREGTPITDRHATVGYVKVEATHNAPNLDTTEQDILNFLDTKQHPENGNVRGQREITNVIFGEALYALTGEYPDIRTISRLPGSANEDLMVSVFRRSGGGLDADWLLDPRYHDGYVGFRLEEVKQKMQ